MMPGDENLCNQVRAEILRNSLLNSENILVESDGDEIVLLGYVDSLDKSWLAEDIAGDTKGVLHVRNEINVLDTSEEDDQEGFYET